MIDKAKDPSKLVICICQQNDESDVDCMKDYANEKNVIIKIVRLTDKDARGPCWARYLIQQEWRGEEYFLQIDSHMRFMQDWDDHCLKNLQMLPEKSCLSNYPSNFNLNEGTTDNVNPLRGGLFIVNKESSEFDGFFRVNSDYVQQMEKPQVARGWGACFSFSRSNLLHDAPYDPYTPYLFFGEEMDIWARMYTNGWYVYAPTEPICFTSFDRGYRPTFWENPDQAHGEYLSRLRLYYRFGYLKNIPAELKIGLDYYNLGNYKTWEQFMKYCLDDEEPTPTDQKIFDAINYQRNSQEIIPTELNITEPTSSREFKIDEAIQ
jgi:glycosyltransferase involved in cell wall biosynthesis